MSESEPDRRDHETNRAGTDERGETTRGREARGSPRDEAETGSAERAMREAGPTDDVPEGAIASVEDFAHQRDERGELLPVAEPVPGKTTTCPTCRGVGEVEVETESDEPQGLGDDGPEFETCSTCDGRGEVQKQVRVRPITQGEANRYLPEDGDVRQLDDPEIFDILREFVVEPDFSSVESLDDFGAFSLDPLLMAVMNASGFDMAQGMVTENRDLMDAIEGNSSRGN
jgi:hypothetical protein